MRPAGKDELEMAGTFDDESILTCGLNSGSLNDSVIARCRSSKRVWGEKEGYRMQKGWQLGHQIVVLSAQQLNIFPRGSFPIGVPEQGRRVICYHDRNAVVVVKDASHIR